MPCNENLEKWKIKVSNLCDVCDQPQSIQHLIFDCPYVKPIWQTIKTCFQIDVTFPLILDINISSPYNNLFTVISFLIYKEWLLKSLEHKGRNNNVIVYFDKTELLFRIKVYMKCKLFDKHNIGFLQYLADHM